MATTKRNRRLKIRKGIRKKVSGTAARPRLSVYKSNRAIYAQLVDDLKGHTLGAVSSLEFDKTKNADVKVSKETGKKIAEKAKAAGIEKVIFDRGGYRYHGQVKALAEGAREGGLKF
jgi:large subunit ribosomal protein L18